MRIFVAFVFATALYAQPSLYAQPARPGRDPAIDRIEKKIAAGTATVQDRVQLVGLYQAAREFDAVRQQVSWLIQNHPEAGEQRTNQLMLEAPMPEVREIAAYAGDLWREQAAKPGANPKAIANAAYFIKTRDNPAAETMIANGLRAHPDDPDLLRMRGTLDAITIGGVIDPIAPNRFDESRRRSQEAARAYQDIESSKDAPLLIGAAETILLNQAAFEGAPALGDQDALTVAERWATRAREFAPQGDIPSRMLARVYEREASQAADPKWKATLYRKADAIDPHYGGLGQLAMAEFEAGDDDAAARDANRMLNRPNPSPNFRQVGHTVLGRVALDRGDIETAKAELLASIPAGANNLQPDRSLAQDLLDKGERDVVIQFLEKFRPLWINDQGALDHYIKLVKSPGPHDIVTPYRAGQEVRGTKPKLPESYAGRAVAIQFRRAACKPCDEEADQIRDIAASKGPDLLTMVIDASETNPLTSQLSIETYPTVVVIGRDGRVQDYLPGFAPPPVLRSAFDRAIAGGVLAQRLTAPATFAPQIVASDGAKPGESGVRLAWSPVPGAESYVVQLDQREPGVAGNAAAWLSDRDQHLVRVIPTAETSVKLDPSRGEIAAPAVRWRVFAVSRLGPGLKSDWREISLVPAPSNQ